ncbi:MAG: hypothetical protein QXV73_04295 [Candidatus Micrarchaeia archaeon]
MIVSIKTGGELWAVVVADDMDFIEHSVIDCVIKAKKMYPNERTVIQGLKEERVEKIKKIVEKRLNQEKNN